MNTNESNQRNDELVAGLVDAFEEQILPPPPSNEDTADWISKHTKLDERTNSRSPNRRKVMRFMAPVAAVAASLAFVVSFWPASNNTFAQVGKQIANAKTVEFSISMKQTNKPELVGRAVAQRPHRMRIDWSVNGQTNVNITNYEPGRIDIVRRLIGFESPRNTEIRWI